MILTDIPRVVMSYYIRQMVFSGMIELVRRGHGAPRHGTPGKSVYRLIPESEREDKAAQAQALGGMGYAVKPPPAVANTDQGEPPLPSDNSDSITDEEVSKLLAQMDAEEGDQPHGA